MVTISGFCGDFTANMTDYCKITNAGRVARNLALLAGKAFEEKALDLEKSGFLVKSDIGGIVSNDGLLRACTLDSDEFAALLEDEIELMGDDFRPTKADYMTAWKIVKGAALETAFPYGKGR